MSSPVYVAGVGVISAIGNNVAENLAAFEREEAGMAEITLLNTKLSGDIPVAEVKLSDAELAAMAGFPSQQSRTTLLSLIAAREALNDAEIGDLSSLRAGFISANTVGGMDKSEDFFIEFTKDSRKGRLRNVFDHECGSMTEAVADKLRLTD